MIELCDGFGVIIIIVIVIVVYKVQAILHKVLEGLLAYQLKN